MNQFSALFRRNVRKNACKLECRRVASFVTHKYINERKKYDDIWITLKSYIFM